MANHQLTGQVIEIGFVDKRRTPSIGNAAGSLATPANYASITSMRTRLAAINATIFSAARLDIMTENDMAYALRVNDDPLGI